MAKISLGVTDTRKITTALSDKGYPDFAGYALVSLKRRLEQALSYFGLTGPDALVARINDEDSFADILVSRISVETTELFRDPSMWRLLRERILPGLFGSGSDLRFWIPGCASAEDPVSLTILLKESGYLNRSAVRVTSLSNKGLENIRTGTLSMKKIEVSEANYSKFQGRVEFSDYLLLREDNRLLDPDLLKDVEFSHERSLVSGTGPKADFIFMRDLMIYLNPNLGNRVLEAVTGKLHTGGILVIGSGECLSNYVFGKNFKQIDESEKIYKKIK
jgi:chemotaxis protein methyltransferase CheR